MWNGIFSKWISIRWSVKILDRSNYKQNQDCFWKKKTTKQNEINIPFNVMWSAEFNRISVLELYIASHQRFVRNFVFGLLKFEQL